MTFRVVVDDNFHYMDEDERYESATYPTVEAALEAARRIVDDYLISVHRPGMTAEQLYGYFTSFGEDPFSVGSDAKRVTFSAWDYAKGRCAEMCGPDGSQIK